MEPNDRVDTDTDTAKEARRMRDGTRMQQRWRRHVSNVKLNSRAPMEGQAGASKPTWPDMGDEMDDS